MALPTDPIKLTFEQLKPYQRRAFIRSRAGAGFFDRVVERLADSGIRTSKSTVNRTWNGIFAKKDPAIVAALEAEYQERPNQRPSRRVA
jgi:hypothetical protein